MIKKTSLTIAFLAALTMLPAAASAATYKIDPAHSAVLFKTKHFGAGYTYGRFMRFTGQFELGKKNSVELEIDASSVFTAQRKRDGHLKSPDFFNVKQFPKISFKSTKVVARGKAYTITGNLTLHGVTKQISIKAKMVGKGKNPMSKQELIGFEGSFTVKRSAYGMSKMIGVAGDAVTLMLAIEGAK